MAERQDEFEPKHEFRGEHTSREGQWEVPYEKPGVPKGEAYGIAAVTQALEGIEFPASKRDVLARVRNERIHWTKAGAPIDLRRILEEADCEEFSSMAGIVSAVGEVVRGENEPAEERDRARREKGDEKADVIIAEGELERRRD